MRVPCFQKKKPKVEKGEGVDAAADPDSSSDEELGVTDSVIGEVVANAKPEYGLYGYSQWPDMATCTRKQYRAAIREAVARMKRDGTRSAQLNLNIPLKCIHEHKSVLRKFQDTKNKLVVEGWTVRILTPEDIAKRLKDDRDGRIWVGKRLFALLVFGVTLHVFFSWLDGRYKKM